MTSPGDVRQEASADAQGEHWVSADGHGRRSIMKVMRRRLSSHSLPNHSTVQNAQEESPADAELPEDPQPKRAVFIDAEAMKEKVRANLALDKRKDGDQYKEKGVCAYIAKHVVFERMMLAVIFLNAIWIAVDTDQNDAEVVMMAHPVFQVAENLFCAAFSFEWIIRFFSFQKMKYVLKDTWFIFDTLMVFMMVLETWVMTAYLLLSSGSSGGGGGLGGNSGVLKIAKLMRLSRMARMARLLRAVPELLIMVKGMITAVRSVAITLTLLILIMYAFGIAFCQMTGGTEVGKQHFPNVLTSMYTLSLYGTLTDNIKFLADELGKENFLFAVFFFLYVLLTSFTVMNMLIGVLCEVVSAVASTEREEILVTYVKSKVLKVVEEIDEDGDRHITKAEMVGILENAAACRALKEVGVDVMSLVDNADAIFVDVKGRELEQLSFPDFMNVVLSLRGTNNATVKDIVELRRSLRTMNEELMLKLQPLMRQMQRVLQEVKTMPRTDSVLGSALLSPNVGGSQLLLEAPPAAERLDLEGSWCPFGEAKAQEVPEWVPTRASGGGGLSQPPRKQQRGTGPGRPPQPAGGGPCAASPPATPHPSLPATAPERGGWCELPEVVPEESIQIPDRPPPEREPSRLIASCPNQLRQTSLLRDEHLRPEEAAWQEVPPAMSIPAPELAGVTPAFAVSRRPPELPSLVVPEAPERHAAFDAASPCWCPQAPAAPSFQPSFSLVCRGTPETGCEDTSEATCTPGSAEDSRCGHLGARLPPMGPETSGWCPVGAAELQGHMAELTRSLTAGLCQVKRLEERLRQPTRSPPPQPAGTPAPSPPVPAIATTSPAVELE